MLEIVPSLVSVTRLCLVGTEKRYSMQIFYSISISKVSPCFAIIEVFTVKFQDFTHLREKSTKFVFIF